MELLDQLDSEMEKIEEGAIRQEGAGMLPSIMDMRHSISNLRRVLGPQRETIGRLSRGDFAMIRPQNRLYFRDVFDQSVRIIDIVESARDVAAGLVEIYLTVASNRLNEIMRVLMVVSVIIMPLTLITGIYGMNVKVPIADSRWGFLDIVVVMGVTAGLLIWYFRKKKWL
jgi:magnesium transporter